MPNEVRQPRWLLLVHQLPPRPSNLRVQVWRRLQHVGAVALRNSLYVLPNTSEAHEDFEWIRSEITGRGGQVSLLAAQVIDGYTDAELEAAFRTARTTEYAALTRDLDGLEKRLASNKRRLPRAALHREVAKARERYRSLKAADFFGAAGASQTEAALERLERRLQPASAAGDLGERLDPRLFRRRVWVTRPRPGIDRMASAWLIRRFIAPDARFAFASAPSGRQIAFDMPDVEFGHQGSDCTYETLMRRFAIADAAAQRIGHLVHDLDLKESRYGVAEGPTIARLVEGLRQAGPSDQALLEHGMAMIEALYRSFVADSDKSTARRSARRLVRSAKAT